MAVQAHLYSGIGFGASQDYVMDNACGLNNPCFTHQQQKLQQEQQLMHRVQPFTPKYYGMDDQQSGAFSQTVAAHIQNHRTEIDQFINSQNGRLRMALQEQRRQQMSLIMKKCESRIQILIRQKDEEIEKAAKRTVELQDYLRRMEIESQTWQRAARDNEAAVASLSSAIERLRESAAAAGDAESCCCPGDNDGMARNENPERKTREMVCKCCHVRNSCVILLPCRHLCSCRDCEAFLDSCPVCKMERRGSIEALI